MKQLIIYNTDSLTCMKQLIVKYRHLQKDCINENFFPLNRDVISVFRGRGGVYYDLLKVLT